MTKYVIFREGQDGSLNQFFDVAGEVEARSAASAISKYLDEHQVGGTYAAVPARSWRPKNMQPKTKTSWEEVQ